MLLGLPFYCPLVVVCLLQQNFALTTHRFPSHYHMFVPQRSSGSDLRNKQPEIPDIYLVFLFQNN